MRKIPKWLFVAAPLGFAIFIAIGGEVVMHLWNWLAPDLFGWRPVTFWQALGLLLLCRILFGGFGGGSRRSNPRQRKFLLAERWEKMTPEERENYRQSWRGRWGPCQPPDSKPNA